MTHKAESLQQILPKKRNGVISSVVVLPDKMEFETQNPNERVYIMLRRHIITNLGWIISLIIFGLLPLIVSILFNYLKVDIYQIEEVKQIYIMATFMVWYLLLLTFSFMKFLDWYFNIYVVTNERLIDFDFSPFAYHKISETGLDCIVDATQESIGFIPMLFNYGDVYIQTAGEKREFDFTAVPRPAWVRDKIMDLRDMIFKKPK